MAKTIVRAPRRDRFLVIDQCIIDDTRLSWAARGMLAYLLSRPDNWQVRIKDLQRRGNMGRDGTYKLVNELRSTGYVEFQQGRDSRGRIRGGSYVVREIPKQPLPEDPDTGLPEQAPPDPVDPGALSITEVNLKNNLPITNITKAGWQGTANHTVGVEFPEWISAELISAALDKVARFDSKLAQLLIDEWAGAYIEGKIKTSPIGYLCELAKRLDRREFGRHYADDIAKVRNEMRSLIEPR